MRAMNMSSIPHTVAGMGSGMSQLRMPPSTAIIKIIRNCFTYFMVFYPVL
jgi:hypothetical protein